MTLVACGGADPQSYSAPVGITLKAKSSDTTGGVVSDQKGITTESGNPYGAFVHDAQADIGADPSHIEVDSATLLLGAGSSGVATLGEIFDGKVEILFLTGDSNNTYPAAEGTVASTAGGGPVDLDVTFDGGSVTDLDYPKFLAGTFKVVIRGPAAASFAGKGADALLQATLTFAAFE